MYSRSHQPQSEHFTVTLLGLIRNKCTLHYPMPAMESGGEGGDELTRETASQKQLRASPPAEREARQNLQRGQIRRGHSGHLISCQSVHLLVAKERMLGNAVSPSLCHVSGQSNDLGIEEEATRLAMGDPWVLAVPRFEAPETGVSLWWCRN